MHRRLIAGGGILAVLLAATACSKTQDAAAETAGGKGAPAEKGGRGPQAGSPQGGPGGPGGRGPTTLMLSPTDVKAVERGLVEEGVAINGDLKPIEEVQVRARLEGDLVGVYVREGQQVSQGQLLARFQAVEEESNQASAIADREAAQSDLATAQWNAEQSEQLFKAGAIAERDHKAALQAVVAAKARVAAAEARVRSTELTSIDTRVIAPTSGVVSVRAVENGEHVARGASMFTVVRFDVLELAGAVPAKDANAIRVGQRVHFNTAGRQLDGRVSRISPTINPANRSLTVYAEVGNPGGVIKGNSFASGRIVSRAVDGVLVIPIAAIRQSQSEGKPFVYRVNTGAIERAPIDLGVVDEAQGVAEITAGLALGDRVIVGNVGALGTGMKVQILGGDSNGRGDPAVGQGSAPGRQGGQRRNRPAEKKG